MAEITVKVRVCDACQDQSKSTKRYTVGEGRRSVQKDLCEDDAEPLEVLMSKSTSPAKKAPERPSSRRSRIHVTPIEEIEKLKR